MQLMLSGFKSCGELCFSKLLYQAIIKVYSVFSKIAGLGSAHKIFRYYNSSGANSLAVCVLKLSLLKQAIALKNYILLMK
ncbi:hypothetical protein [Ruminococcus sp.]|uniref:hypothetical protein n=1 Tax=Ruminococcus sp. TaxID=41978 RepID=UPI003520DABD